jgi:hypothetical protein
MAMMVADTDVLIDFLNGMLVQREMENRRSPLVSKQPFPPAQFGLSRPMKWRGWWTSQAAEAATGFKTKPQLGAPSIQTSFTGAPA